MSDRLLSGFGAIIRALLPSLTAYVVWSYRVVSVTSATPPVKIDCRPVSSLCPYGPQAGMTLWPGPSGTVAVPQVGSLVRLAFADASPSNPMIVGLDPSAPPTMVFVGETAGEFAALASRVAQLQTAYNAHTHGGVTTGSGTSGTPSAPSAINFASSKVQVAS